jgi:hypothetical protein
MTIIVDAAFAQSTYLGGLNRDLYLAKVKLIDEFIARFNGEEIRLDVSKEYANRKEEVLTLLNLQNYSSKNDSAFICAEIFAQAVARDSIMLNFEDRDWYAKIRCRGKLNKEEVCFTMNLSVESNDGFIYRWVISDVDGSIFYTSRDKPHTELFIMPNDNEQFFQSIPKISTETSALIDDYAKDGYKADPLSVFLTLVRSNQLIIESVDQVEFVFLQVPGYIFTVKNFNRNSLNSGWLIDSIAKCDEENRLKILKKLHL